MPGEGTPEKHIEGAPPWPTTGGVALPDELTRLRIDREFVCLLAIPGYVRGLLDQGYLEQPAFRAYLRYLQYWRQPPYTRYLPYPSSLFFLEKLLDNEFRFRLASNTGDLAMQATMLDFYTRQQSDRILESQYRRGQELEAWKRARGQRGRPETRNSGLLARERSVTAAAAAGEQPLAGPRAGPSDGPGAFGPAV